MWRNFFIATIVIFCFDSWQKAGRLSSKQKDTIEVFNRAYDNSLEDRQENAFTDLRWDTYFATISESGTGRFCLHFKDATAIGEIAPETNISFNVLDGKIVIHNPDKEKGTISLVNISGQVWGRMEMNGDESQEFSIDQAAGIYLISIQTEKAMVSRKVFLR